MMNTEVQKLYHNCQIGKEDIERKREMAKDKKLVEHITAMDEDFAQWYTDVVRKAELCDYTSVKGCMVFKPAGYAIWELIQKNLDERFKATGVENVYLPMFIPESLLEKEKDHVEGFAPEVAWVTHGGLNELPERLCVRPTSETLFCDFILRRSRATVIFQRYITSGVPLCVGRRRQDHSFARESSCGRKVIPHMQQQKRQRQERSRC